MRAAATQENPLTARNQVQATVLGTWGSRSGTCSRGTGCKPCVGCLARTSAGCPRWRASPAWGCRLPQPVAGCARPCRVPEVVGHGFHASNQPENRGSSVKTTRSGAHDLDTVVENGLQRACTEAHAAGRQLSSAQQEHDLGPGIVASLRGERSTLAMRLHLTPAAAMLQAFYQSLPASICRIVDLTNCRAQHGGAPMLRECLPQVPPAQQKPGGHATRR